MKKKLLLMTVLFSLALAACGGEASVSSTSTEVQSTKQSEETVDVNYEQMIVTMSAYEEAFDSSYARTAFTMANTLVGTKQLEAGSTFDFHTLSSPEVMRLNYQIMKEICYNYYPDIEFPDYTQDDSGAGFYKDDLENILHSFYQHDGQMYIDGNQFAERDGMVYTMLGDGDPWILIDGFSIKEDAGYVLLNAPCYYGDNGGAENIYMYHVNILFRKTEDSIFGLQMVYANAYTHSIAITSAEATSQLPDSGSKSYGPENLIDKNYKTVWAENAPDTGAGQVITLHLDSVQPVQDVLLYNGYLDTKHLYDTNGKVTKVNVDFCNGYSVETDLYPYDYYGADDAELTDCYPHRIGFGYPMMTDTITITITSACEGTKYSDTCISEIELH